MKRFLEGITIIDLSRLIPGPFCSLILSDLGAKVIRVEDPIRGDYLRDMGGTLFTAINRGKKTVKLDLKSVAGRKKFLKLVKKCDVLIESFRPGVMAGLGLSFGKLKKINPRIILASITGFGQSGPNKGRAGHDLNYMSFSGMLGPQIPSMQWADYVGGGLMGALSILAALRRVNLEKKALHLDISMTDSMIFCGMGSAVLAQTGERLDYLSGLLGRYHIYKTSDDRYVAFAALEGKFWNRFCDLTGRPQWKDGEKKYQDASQEIKNELKMFFRTKTLDEWARLGRENDICLTPVLSPREAVKSPQFRTRRYFLEKTSGGKRIKFPRFPLTGKS